MSSIVIGAAGAILVGMQSVSLLGAIGKDLICKTVSVTTSTTISTLKYITNTDQPKFEETRVKFEKLDLQHTISVIQELIKEQNSRKDMKKSVKFSILGVDDIIQDINIELAVVKKAMDDHKNKYFSKWRAFDCNKNIDKITNLKRLLDNRYKILTGLLKIYNSQYMNTNNKKIKGKTLEKNKISIQIENMDDLC